MSLECELCEVVFPYSKVNDDELELAPGNRFSWSIFNSRTLSSGQIIEIITKDLEDPGWWKGKLNGKVGVFPDNFVKQVKKSSPAPELKKTISVEEKYDLGSLKKELNLRFVIMNQM